MMGVRDMTPDFFATQIMPIIQTEEFVRVTFCHDGRALSIVLTPTAYRAMTRQIVEGPGPVSH